MYPPPVTELVDDEETPAAFVRGNLEGGKVRRTILDLNAYAPVRLHDDLEGSVGVEDGVRGKFAQGQGEVALRFGVGSVRDHGLQKCAGLSNSLRSGIEPSPDLVSHRSTPARFVVFTTSRAHGPSSNPVRRT